METPAERTFDDGALVAREYELAVLRDAIGAARAGRGRLVIVEGAPGSGKTRLVREAVAAARDQGMRVVWLPNGGDGGAMAAEAALKDAAPPGMVLVADDEHGADPVRLALLTSIADALCFRPVLALVTRTVLAGPVEQRGLGGDAERHATHVRLGPFRPGTVIALAARMGVAMALPVLERLHAVTGGTAFLVVETLAELARTDQGDGGGPWPLTERALQWTRARLDVLPRGGREAVEVASVLGEECDVALVAQVLGTTIDPAELGAVLAESGFMLTPKGRACCRFVPPLVRDLVYALLSAERRAALHARAATICVTSGATSSTVLAHRGLAALAAGNTRGCEHHLRRLAEQRAPAGAPVHPTGWPYFVREGENWAIGFADRAIRLHDRVGLRYLARLLSRPCVEFSAQALGEPSRRRNGFEASEQATAAERARVRVTRRIRDGIERIGEVHPELGAHLERTIHTGARCAYVVDPASGPSWEVRSSG